LKNALYACAIALVVAGSAAVPPVPDVAGDPPAEADPVVEVDAGPDEAAGPPLELHAHMLINNTVAAATVLMRGGRITARFYRIRADVASRMTRLENFSLNHLPGESKLR
jgi:hypothetical protein